MDIGDIKALCYFTVVESYDELVGEKIMYYGEWLGDGTAIITENSKLAVLKVYNYFDGGTDLDLISDTDVYYDIMREFSEAIRVFSKVPFAFNVEGYESLHIEYEVTKRKEAQKRQEEVEYNNYLKLKEKYGDM